jgi:hypothetical protein
VGPGADLDLAVKKKKKILPVPLSGIEQRSSNPQPSHYTDSAAQGPFQFHNNSEFLDNYQLLNEFPDLCWIGPSRILFQS